MALDFFRRRRKTGKNIVSLRDLDSGDNSDVTNIARPDSISLLGHEPVTAYPGGDATIRAEISRRVAQLAARGALDEFTVNALASWLDALREQWTRRTLAEARDRQITAALLIAQDIENLRRMEVTLGARRQTAKELEILRDELLRHMTIKKMADVDVSTEIAPPEGYLATAFSELAPLSTDGPAS